MFVAGYLAELAEEVERFDAVPSGVLKVLTSEFSIREAMLLCASR